MPMWNILAIAVGGACGAVCRYGVSVACRSWFGPHFAFGTLAVNVIGCFLLGVLAPLGDEWTTRFSPTLHAALTVGFLGALTTFSTFGLETYQFVEDARHHVAAYNVALNVAAGIAAVAGGLVLGRHLAA
ncbi:fluoride efflux transporter CrcB [Pirellulales bacterium]|nr:fluoride efflux transporter CrcB [Pirellulales bacterium]